MFAAPPLGQCVQEILSATGLHPADEKRKDLSRRTVGVLGSTRLLNRLASSGFDVLCLSFDERTATRKTSVAGHPLPAILQTRQGPPEQTLPLTHDLGALVSVGTLSRLESDVPLSHAVRALGSTVTCGGLLLMAELSAEGSLGRILLRFGRIFRSRVLGLDPADVCAAMLTGGIRPVRQIWPQGVKSYVVTYGPMGPFGAGAENLL